MVIYDLICAQGHHFEGWFTDLEDLEAQLNENKLACPVCSDGQISRCPSTFGLVKHARPAPPGPPEPPLPSPPAPPARMLEALKQLESLAGHLEREYDDVGSGFADEALKIHYGVTQPRNIRGLSTAAQEEILHREGVEFFKVPLLSRKNTPSTNN
ncbi:MAG: DUF1178 family protein [Candidatus Adiutrix sp.]|jgi:hypothetical protein|nr:DUF1178 family protein [Candidatus Adiutrix sp.]